MKILLDECVTKKIKNYLSEFDVSTVTEMGWSGVKNGKLMKLCIENKIDILITIDKNLMFQQNLKNILLQLQYLIVRLAKLKN